MANVLIVYGSTTGNTQWVAGEIKKEFEGAGHSVDVKSVDGVNPDGLCGGKDMVLFGCSTWGQDEIELQEDFVPLYEAFDKIGASGVKAAVFGCGDEDYAYYCGAVDAIYEKLESMGAVLKGEKLKLNGDPADSADSIKSWARALVQAL